MLQFIPEAKNGIISIIFKYNEIFDSHKAFEKTVEYYTFELNNEKAQGQFSIKMYFNGEPKLIQSFSATEINKQNLAYIPKKINSVQIEVINDSITIRVSQDNGGFFNVFNLIDNKIANGSIGFGTSKTPARFIGVYLNPPKLSMTNPDIEMIITNKIFGVPFTSPRKIKEAFDKSDSLNEMLNNNTALGKLYQQISILRSSLGFDFSSSARAESHHAYKYYGGNAADSDSREEFSAISSIGWRQCVIAKDDISRKNYCENKFDNQVLKDKCQVNIG